MKENGVSKLKEGRGETRGFKYQSYQQFANARRRGTRIEG
jgi:hypothetical protein